MGDTNSSRTASELAALYVSGAMSPDERADFEEALGAGNDEYRREVEQLEPASRSLIQSIEPIEPSPDTKARIMRAASERARSAGEPTPQVWNQWTTADEAQSKALFTLRSEEGAWEDTGIEGIRVRRLFVDRPNNRMTAMFQMAPGTEYVPHTHDQPEECYVLEGDLHVGDDLVMHAGDYQRAPAGSHHGIQRTEQGCLLLITCSLSDELDYNPAAN